MEIGSVGDWAGVVIGLLALVGFLVVEWEKIKKYTFLQSIIVILIATLIGLACGTIGGLITGDGNQSYLWLGAIGGIIVGAVLGIILVTIGAIRDLEMIPLAKNAIRGAIYGAFAGGMAAGLGGVILILLDGFSYITVLSGILGGALIGAIFGAFSS